MIQGQFAVQSKIYIVLLLKSAGKTDRYINDHRDKYHYVIHFINEAGVFNRRTKDGYVNISSAKLRDFLGRRYADCIMRELLVWGIIECDGLQREGIKTYGYRITSAYQSKTILVNVFKEEVMGRKLKLKQLEYQQTRKMDIRWRNLTQFGIREQKALAYIDAKRTTALYVLGPDQVDSIADVERLYTAELESIRKIANEEFFLEQPDPTSRVYTNLSNLSTDLRQFLYHRKSKSGLMNLDIANSQPYLFSLLLMDFYRGRELPTDVKKYIQLTAAGEFYEYLMTKLGIEHDQRKAFKIDFFGKSYYCSSYYSKRTSEGQFFAEEFPNVATIIDHYKEEGRKHYDHKPFKHLAISMQRREASVILRTIGGQLEKKKIWFSTIHDSVVVLQEHAEEVKILILTSFCKAIGVSPKVSEEVLTTGFY